jgi:hypothetical protein
MKERGLWIHGWVVVLVEITMPTKRFRDWEWIRRRTPPKQRLHPQLKRKSAYRGAKSREGGEELWFKRR